MTREVLTDWGIEWRGVRQQGGECVVLGEGAWGEWWGEEVEGVEVGVVTTNQGKVDVEEEGGFGGYGGGFGGYGGEGNGACGECLRRYGMSVAETVVEGMEKMDLDEPVQADPYVGKGKGKEV